MRKVSWCPRSAVQRQTRGMLAAEVWTIAPLPPSRITLLTILFFVICCGLGYPSLNRVDWRQAPGGLTDVVTYADMVSSPTAHDLHNHMRFRILVPYLARPVYQLAKGHVGTWDPVMFSLLVVTAACVALTAILLLLIVFDITGLYGTALVAALLYLLNFAVPNLRLEPFSFRYSTAPSEKQIPNGMTTICLSSRRDLLSSRCVTTPTGEWF